MIYAKPFAEDMALQVAYAYEQATNGFTRRPDLAWAGIAAGTADPALSFPVHPLTAGIPDRDQGHET